MPRRTPPLHKGMTLREVRRILGDNEHDEWGDGSLYTFEHLVWDPVEWLRLASARVWFRDGRSTRWADEVALVADTWGRIKAGDPPTLWAAGRMGEPPREVRDAMVAMLAQRVEVERVARVKAKRAAARRRR